MARKLNIDKVKLKDKWQTFSVILAMFAVAGSAAQTLKKAAQNTTSQIDKVITFRATTHAALRGMMELDAVGKIKIDGTLVNLELRHDIVSGAKWVFIINGHIEMYEAVYSEIWRGYHYVDASGKYRQIRDLEYIKEEDYGKVN